MTPIQQLLLIRSIAGHVTPSSTPEHADTALSVIRGVLDGADPLSSLPTPQEAPV